jgi:tryptophanyl-tRNA synthetase
MVSTDTENLKMKPRILTGMRPTNNLTLGNYAGGIIPILKMQDQKKDEEIFLFVATLHGITDGEPKDIMPHVLGVVGDYLACGVDPNKVLIYDQYSIRKEIALITLYIERHVTAARLLRLPTLKDKLKGEQTPEQANVMLMNYPLMMAADILCQNATDVPVGKDQYAHIELAGEIVDSFNRKYGRVLVRPRVLEDPEEETKPMNLLSLRGAGKMSKSNPDGALFLLDTQRSIVSKIKKSETANVGEKSAKLDNLIAIAELTGSAHLQSINALYQEHLGGAQVMSSLKELVATCVIEFLEPLKERRASISNDHVRDVLNAGAAKAQANAQSVLERMEQSMGLVV